MRALLALVSILAAIAAGAKPNQSPDPRCLTIERTCDLPQVVRAEKLLTSYLPTSLGDSEKRLTVELSVAPKDEVAALKKDITGYQLFVKLSEQFADEVIRASRRERKKKNRRENPKS